MEYKHVCKLRAVGLVDVYQYYNDEDSPCIVRAESQSGKVLAERSFDNEEDFCDVLGDFDPYDDIAQGEKFLNLYYRNQDEGY
jgi:hypothetical protein